MQEKTRRRSIDIEFSPLDDLEFRTIKGTLYTWTFDYRSYYTYFYTWLLFSSLSKIDRKRHQRLDLFIIAYIENHIFMSFKALYLSAVLYDYIEQICERGSQNYKRSFQRSVPNRKSQASRSSNPDKFIQRSINASGFN